MARVTIRFGGPAANPFSHGMINGPNKAINGLFGKVAALKNDVAATPGLEDVDVARRQLCVGGEDVGAAAIAPYAERQHRRMFDKEQLVAELARAALLDQARLQVQRLAVLNQPQVLNSERTF